MTEDKLQYEIAEFLRENNIVFFHVPNGGKRSKREAAKFVAIGVVAGVHDLIILLPDAKAIFIELKLKDGRLSNFQKLFHGKVESLGFNSYTVKAATASGGIAQVKSILLSHGLQFAQ